MVDFGKLFIRDAFFTPAAGEPGILRVCDPHALIQAAGYLKYGCAKEGEFVFFRGQSKHYKTMPPSIMRQGKTAASQNKRLRSLNKAIDDVIAGNNLLQSLPKQVVEPLLQHYGFKTTWIDLVDNIWVALWFACHHARSVGKFGQYMHFERRQVPREDNSEFAYVYMVAADSRPGSLAGTWTGPKTELVDLRVCCPSLYVRPHAQHGVLFRARGEVGGRPSEYSSQVRGIIEIELGQALRWLGEGEMLGVRSLFPPPYYDQGYQWLLESGYPGHEVIGSIAHVGS